MDSTHFSPTLLFIIVDVFFSFNYIVCSSELSADAVPQPFIDYYTQAECSVNALLQIRFNNILSLEHHIRFGTAIVKQCFSFRSEWDMFVVAADHPDGSSIPQNWIMPDQPSDGAWASALHLAGSG